MLTALGLVVLATIASYTTLFMPTFAIRQLGIPASWGFTATLLVGAIQFCLRAGVRQRCPTGSAALPVMTTAAVADAGRHRARLHAADDRPQPGDAARRCKAASRWSPPPISARCRRRHGGPVPGPHPRHRPVDQLQLRRDDLRRLRPIHHRLADRADRQLARPQLLCRVRRGGQPARPVSARAATACAEPAGRERHHGDRGTTDHRLPVLPLRTARRAHRGACRRARRRAPTAPGCCV